MVMTRFWKRQQRPIMAAQSAADMFGDDSMTARKWLARSTADAPSYRRDVLISGHKYEVQRRSS
jgi:hypothetical protein